MEIQYPIKPKLNAPMTTSSSVAARPDRSSLANFSKTGADILVVEAGGEDVGATVTDPSIWFYNVGGPLDWALPITPAPQLNNRRFNMALGRVVGGGSSVNAMVWTRGLERDYERWEREGATGWGFKEVLPTFKAQEDWEGGATIGVARPVLSAFARRVTRIPLLLPSSTLPGKWAFLFLGI